MQQYTVSYPKPKQASVQLGPGRQLTLWNPPVGDAISWNVGILIDDSNPSASTISGTVFHTCYPAHIVKVNGMVVYEWKPPDGIGSRPVGMDYIAPCLFGNSPVLGVIPTTVVSNQ
jgi:hypothetical protein